MRGRGVRGWGWGGMRELGQVERGVSGRGFFFHWELVAFT